MRWGRILTTWIAVLGTIVATSRPGMAAEVTIVRKDIFAEQDMPPTGCNVVLKGSIETGDLGKLKAAYLVAERGGKYTPSYLCLDSPGGHFIEAIDILRWLIDRETAISTVIDMGKSCMSACALIFMGGSEYIHLGRKPRRWLHVAGQLGFHAPYLDASDLPRKSFETNEVVAAFTAAMAGARGLLTEFSRLREQVDEGPFPGPWVKPSLLNELLLRGPSEALLIDTIDRAGRWEIDLFGWRPIHEVSQTQARTACRNAVAWIGDRYATELHASEVRGAYAMEPSKHDASFDAQFNRTKYEFWVNGRETSSCSLEFATHQTGRVTSATATFAGGGSFGGENRTWIAFAPATKLVSLSASIPARRGAVLGAPVGRAGITGWNNHDLEGGDLRHTKGGSQAECGSVCDADQACVAYSYDKWNRWCFLKASLGTLRFDPKYAAATKSGQPVRSSVPIAVQVYRGKTFAPGARGGSPAASFEICQRHCDVLGHSCVAFTFLKSQQRCETLTEAGEYFSDADADSGVKRQAPSR